MGIAWRAGGLTVICSVDSQVIQQAVEFLKSGLLVAFPTETVYGLGADAQSEKGLRRLYEAKGRPEHHPVIVHLASFEQISSWCELVPTTAQLLAKHFWPGPLTMILSRSKKASNLVTGGQDTVGIRVPSHPAAQSLLKAFGDGIAAPSANRFGHISSTTAAHVEAEFGDQLAMVLDGGSCQVGIESTIVDLTSDQPQILRPGMISSEAICEVLGIKVPSDLTRGKSTVRAPGSLLRHYATKAPLKLMERAEIMELVKGSATTYGGTEKSIFAIVSFVDEPEVDDLAVPIAKWIKASEQPREYAKSLYSNLRELDASGATSILVEIPPGDPSWSAIQDRLTRAATHSSDLNDSST
jgi:L-threonylcarbamoyladenylate synthase